MAETQTENKPVSAAPAPNGSGNGNGAPAADAPPAAPDAAPPKAEMSPTRKIILFGALAIALIAAIIFGVRAFSYNNVHSVTDDAFVSGDLINISPKVAGRLAKLTVEEGDYVQKGKLIARLDSSTQEANVRSAAAAYEAAVSQIPQAETNLKFQISSTDAAIQRARSAEEGQRARAQGAREQVTLTQNTTRNQVRQAESQVRAAQATAQQVTAQIKTAQNAVATANRAYDAARKGVDALRARRLAADAEALRARRDLERYRDLLTKEAVTQQQFDSVQAQEANARGQVATLLEQIAQAEAQARQSQAAVAQAQSQIKSAQRAAQAAQEQVNVALAGVAVAQANAGQVGIQSSNSTATSEQINQQSADLATAIAGRDQVKLRQQQIETAKAQAAQLKAALESAKVAFQDTFIYAPSDGIVVKKAANVGNSLNTGQTIATMTKGSDVWVTANFKETQLAGVRAGQNAEMDVDGFPGVKFEGRVASINQVTGASTSLLPPDNATGNFTKVVQRIPVKILFVPVEPGNEKSKKFANEEEIRRLRQGMSVVVAIYTGKDEKKQKGQ